MMDHRDRPLFLKLRREHRARLWLLPGGSALAVTAGALILQSLLLPLFFGQDPGGLRRAQAATALLSTAAALGTVALMTLLINFRHLVYGLSMLEKFRGMGWRKFYMIFSLTDETYALLSSAQAPVGVDPRNFYFAIALLDHSYWILGSVIGAVAGALIPVDTKGIDFAMTALFVVIAVDQWKAYRKHLPALLGFGVTILFLIILGRFFGQQQMLIVSLGVIVLLLLILRDKLEEKEEKKC